MMRPSRFGFSLVELSIVLVILGLLVGGVLAGKSLIRASELRAIGTEYNRYLTATFAFRDKYFALPGDMTTAESFWGSAQVSNANCKADDSTAASTCNGDGNGLIEASYVRSNEIFRFWEHLANAGLIEGSYTGAAGPAGVGTGDATIGVNCPASKFPSGGWYVSYRAPGGSGVAYDLTYGNIFWYGGKVANGQLYGQILKPEEAWSVDTKLDDGKPGRGKIGPFRWDDCTDSATNASLDGSYLLSDSGQQCSLFFRQLF